MQITFEWDVEKNRINIEKHHISFYEAQKVFLDLDRVVLKDFNHSDNHEDRYFCIGKVENDIITVRFVVRNNSIRIFGAGYWRKGRNIYEKENKIY